MTDQTAWLIERKYNSVTNYFTAFTGATICNEDWAFRTEPECAVMFARREDAEQFLKTYLGGLGCVAEHKWVTP